MRFADWVYNAGLDKPGVKIRREERNYCANLTQRIRTADGKRETVHKNLGIVTPTGVVPPYGEIARSSSVIIQEFGFSQACLERASLTWKNRLGEEWLNALVTLIEEISPTSFLLGLEHAEYQSRKLGALRDSLEADISMPLADFYKAFATIVLITYEDSYLIAAPSEAQRELAKKLGISLGGLVS